MSGSELSPVPREARPFQGEPAVSCTRLLANTIDAVVVCRHRGLLPRLGGVRFILDPLTFTFPRAGLLSSSPRVSSSRRSTWASRGGWRGSPTAGTPARAQGCRPPGARARSRASFARAGFCAFFPIGLFWCLVSPRRRSVQDIVVWSVVLYDWAPHPTKEAAASHVATRRSTARPAPLGSLPSTGSTSATPPEPRSRAAGLHRTRRPPLRRGPPPDGPAQGPTAPTAASGPPTAEAS